ncbi:hypothetical protein CTI12_AA405650 [Artemisia annua]|uniref:ATP-dependent DNA helicase n=1 Tax=Artemisia annua TaxID=35608 RepID=A0A2U1M971_ARTAN|nr:hypothetical protein CTI12_AA405650 [Artemisia annua]
MAGRSVTSEGDLFQPGGVTSGGSIRHGGDKLRQLHEKQLSENKAKSGLAALLKKHKLIILDEAPMTNKLCFEALDCSLRDMIRKSRYDDCQTPFGSMTVEDVSEIRDFAEWILKVGDGELGGAKDIEISKLEDNLGILNV